MQNPNTRWSKESAQHMTEEEKRLHRCCFTGHRPEKLQRSERQIKAELESEINKAVKDGFTVFISGMARGVDYGK